MAKFKRKDKKERKVKRKEFAKYFLVSFLAFSMIFSTVAYYFGSDNSHNVNVVFDQNKGLFVFNKDNKQFYSFAPLYNYNLQYNVSFKEDFYNSNYFFLSKNFSSDNKVNIIAYVLNDNVNRGFSKTIGQGYLDADPYVNCSLASKDNFVLELINSTTSKVEYENNCLKLYYSSFEDLAVESSFFIYEIFNLI